MKSLSDSNYKQEILARLAKIRPDSQRRWGKMKAPQMICHLNDAFLGVMGDKAISIPEGLSFWPIFKWIPLYAPMRWPPGIPTRPEVDQLIGGTSPTHFDVDLQKLLDSIGKFTRLPRPFQFQSHPMFRVMSVAQWMRWGYLHMDHHLRQFGE